MSFKYASQVSATTGSDHQYCSASGSPRLTFQRMTASRTTPTLCVFVIMTGPSINPESSTQCVPVISPLPFKLKKPPKTASRESLPRGRTAVTPVRTGPTPALSGPSPEINVVYPTSTPLTSVMALRGPGLPSKATPRSRALGFTCEKVMEQTKTIATDHILELSFGIQTLLKNAAV